MIGGRAVVVPLRAIGELGDLAFKGAALGADAVGSIDPDVLGNDLAFLVDVFQES